MIDPDTSEPTERPDDAQSDDSAPDSDVPDTSGAGYGNHGEADD